MYRPPTVRPVHRSHPEPAQAVIWIATANTHLEFQHRCDTAPHRWRIATALRSLPLPVLCRAHDPAKLHGRSPPESVPDTPAFFQTDSTEAAPLLWLRH